MANDVILFIGAGFSKPAGVPLMTEFVTLFENRLKEKNEDFHKYFLTIKKHMTETAGTGNIDLEKLMDILDRLASEDSMEMSVWQEKNELTKFNEEVRKSVKIELEDLIRKKCIIDPTTKLDDYSPLNDVFKAIKPLDIFSVNYDDVLEVFCYKSKYTLEDGFALYWDPTRFDNLDGIDVRLLKLHGSVLWYRTEEGAYYKVLLKVPKEYNKLITGEQLEQLIAYPVAGKPIHVAPLAYAMNELRKRLEEVSQCFIVGYSMRDKHLIDIFTEALRRNDKLRLILVSPNPFEILKSLKHEALMRSIIPAAFKTKEILYGNRLLRISGFVRVISERPVFEAMKNPLKAAQEYFQALDYETALQLVRSEEFKKAQVGINLRMVDFANILAGLFYARIISRHTGNQGLETEIFKMIEEFLCETAKSSIQNYQDIQSFLEHGIQAAKWVTENLQGALVESVKTYTTPKISVLKHALSELGRKKDSDIEELKKFLERKATILLKWQTETQVPYDDSDFKWLFA